MTKILSIFSVGALLLLSGCASNSSQRGTPDSLNEADTLQLIEKEILEADSIRLDSLHNDSIIKVEKDSISKARKDSMATAKN